jgi:cell division protein FtsZ
VGVVTKPFHFEGRRRMLTAEKGIEALQENVDTLIVIPNQNLFRIANDKTTFADAFAMADQVLYSGVACITDLMVKEGLINLDFADVRSVMRNMGKAMMGTGEASADGRALAAAEAAISNPLLDETSMNGAQGLLISITGGRDMTLFEVDEAATRIREEVDPEANIIVGATFDESLEGVIRVSVVATGIDGSAKQQVTDQRPQLTQPAPRPQVMPARATAPVSAPATQATAPVQAAPVAVPVSAPVATQQPAASAAQADIALPHLDDEIANIINRADDWEDQVARGRSSTPGETFRPRSTIFGAAPQASVAPQPTHVARAPQPVAPQIATPSAPVAAAPAQPRMPRIEEFPAPAQAAYEERAREPQSRGEEPSTVGGLLRRLTHGLTRRDDEVHSLAPAQPREPSLRPAGEARRAEPQPSIYAPRRDDAGRSVAAANGDEDMLDIPAFLRRHAN